MMADDPKWPFPVGDEVGANVVPLRAGEDGAPLPAKILRVISFMDAQPNLNSADFVERLHIEGQLSIVYGESNAGKTFWVTDLGFHIAAGIEWNGREVTQGPVLYLALEGSFGIINRIAAFKQERGLDDTNVPFYVVPQGLDLLHPEGDVEAVIATIKDLMITTEVNFNLIVVDTVARAIPGGDENSGVDMGAFIKNLDTIRHETGAHVMGIHHSGKDLAKGARGWSGLRGAIDTEIEVRAEEQSKSAEVVKQRDLPKGDVFAFSLKVVVLGTDRRGKDVTSCVIESVTDQAAGAASDRRSRPKLTGHSKRAFDVLVDLVGQSGEPGHGAPPGCVSIPEKWWRERFYESAMAGSERKAKEKAFSRASDALISSHVVGMMRSRVWIVSKRFEPQNTTQNGDIYGDI